jgi:hypothetical protein
MSGICFCLVLSRQGPSYKGIVCTSPGMEVGGSDATLVVNRGCAIGWGFAPLLQRNHFRIRLHVYLLVI